MGNNAKRKAKQFCLEYKLKDSSKENITQLIEKFGYTIVEFNYIYNDVDVQILIDALKLTDDLIKSRGFTFVDANHRIVFLNEDLSDEEKRIVLIHELGHIYCKHFNYGTIIGTDVQDEHEANEFEHYLLQIPIRIKAIIWISEHKKILCCALIICFIISIAFGICIKKNLEEKKYYGEYYVTETGLKYHEKNCIYIKDKISVHRLTKEEFESGNYEPCKTCLP